LALKTGTAQEAILSTFNWSENSSAVTQLEALQEEAEAARIAELQAAI
jgi:hypothetical protein